MHVLPYAEKVFTLEWAHFNAIAYAFNIIYIEFFLKLILSMFLERNWIEVAVNKNV